MRHPLLSKYWQQLRPPFAAFVSEHSETLVELDIEYKELADKNGCKNYTRVPALGTNENYIKAMSNLIIKKQDYHFNGELMEVSLKRKQPYLLSCCRVLLRLSSLQICYN